MACESLPSWLPFIFHLRFSRSLLRWEGMQHMHESFSPSMHSQLQLLFKDAVHISPPLGELPSSSFPSSALDLPSWHLSHASIIAQSLHCAKQSLIIYLSTSWDRSLLHFFMSHSWCCVCYSQWSDPVVLNWSQSTWREVYQESWLSFRDFREFSKSKGEPRPELLREKKK